MAFPTMNLRIRKFLDSGNIRRTVNRAVMGSVGLVIDMLEIARPADPRGGGENPIRAFRLERDSSFFAEFERNRILRLSRRRRCHNGRTGVYRKESRQERFSLSVHMFQLTAKLDPN